MKKLLLLITCLSIFNLAAWAQSEAKITGTITDQKGDILPFANVFLLNSSDSSIVKAEMGKENGDFLFEQIPFGSYLVSASMVGYEKFISPSIILSAENKIVNLAKIVLPENAKVLKGVEVVAKKPLLEQHADKLVMNVENSIVSAGSTAFELLQRAPGVSIDQNDNISLKGKQGVLIYLDGKPSYMSQDQLTTLLKNMGSDQIEKIEIISNPSSKYDAAGKSGILNIITKKNKNFGTNGSVSFGGSLSIPDEYEVVDIEGSMPKYNGSINLNNRKGKFNTFGNLSFRSGKNFNVNEFYRILDDKTFDQYSYRYGQYNSFSGRVGTDYFINKKTTVGVLLNTNIGDWQTKPPMFNETLISQNNELESSLITTSSPKETWKNITFNTNFKHAFNDKGKELTADFDYSHYDNLNKERAMITTFYDNLGNADDSVLLVTSNIPNIYKIFAAKVDFSLPLVNDKGKFEFGAKSSYVNSDNDIAFMSNGKPDLGRSNYFIYKEKINALYTNFSKKFNEKWSVQTGLRLEYTDSKGESITLDTINSRDYLNLFPTFYLTHNLNKNNIFNFNYSRRIDRPDYSSLNPFVFFLDPYTYQLGNEKLKPQITDAVELSHTFKGMFITSLGYSYTKDFVSQIVKNAKDDEVLIALLNKYNPNQAIEPENISFAIQENIGTYQNFNITFSFPVKVNKWWSMNNNFTGYHSIYEGEIDDYILDENVYACNFFTSQNFVLKKSLTAELSMWYNSPSLEGTFRGREMYAINAGVAKTFFKKKATLKINVNDIFATARWRGRTDFGSVNMNIRNHWDSRRILATFTYAFGNQNVKGARSRQTATSAEQSRVKSGQ